MARGDYLKCSASQELRVDPARRLLEARRRGRGCFMLRRNLLVAPLLLAATPAMAQWVPKQPIKILVGYAPGGTADIAARIAADSISRQHGYTVIVDNKTGAGGFIALKQ